MVKACLEVLRWQVRGLVWPDISVLKGGVVTGLDMSLSFVPSSVQLVHVAGERYSGQLGRVLVMLAVPVAFRIVDRMRHQMRGGAWFDVAAGRAGDTILGVYTASVEARHVHIRGVV